MNSEFKNQSNWRERYRVRIGFVFALIFIFRAQPRVLVFLIFGLVISFLGVFLRQWSAGCVKKMDELAMKGPYALVRHPLYVGSFLVGLGFILASSSFSFKISKPFFDRTLLFWCFLWLLIDSIYFPKIRKEEKDLEAKFSGQYSEYAQKVPRFVPNTFHWSNLDFSSFSVNQWLKNKEYWSLVGYAIVSLILVARYYYN